MKTSSFAVRLWGAASLLLCLRCVSSRHASRELSFDEGCTSEMKWSTENGNVLLNGVPFVIKGLSWFGFEAEERVVYGLFEGGQTMDEYLDQVQELQFNALRIPLSLKLALNPDTLFNPDYCVECKSEYTYDVIDALMDKAADRGILVLFDMHNLNESNTNELWYDDVYSEEDFIDGWVNILNTFGGKRNFMGIDILNEPHGSATWGMGLDTDWNKAVERIARGIKEAVPTFDQLILVQGVDMFGAACPYSTDEPAYVKFWGSNFDGLYSTEVDLGEDLDHLLVYSSHIYGQSLVDMYYFHADDFPDNMQRIWDMQVGFIESMTSRPVIIGEWGGAYVDDEAVLLDTWSAYMAKNCIGDAFFWSLTPNSRDVGGILLDDWKTIDEDKAKVLERSQPNPSYFTKPIGDEICVNYGEHSNGKVCSASTEMTWNYVMPGMYSIKVRVQDALHTLLG